MTYLFLLFDLPLLITTIFALYAISKRNLTVRRLGLTKRKREWFILWISVFAVLPLILHFLYTQAPPDSHLSNGLGATWCISLVFSVLYLVILNDYSYYTKLFGLAKTKHSLGFLFDLERGHKGYEKTLMFEAIFGFHPYHGFDHFVTIKEDSDIQSLVTIANEFHSYRAMIKIHENLPSNDKMSEHAIHQKMELEQQMRELKQRLMSYSPLLIQSCYKWNEKGMNPAEKKAVEKLENIMPLQPVTNMEAEEPVDPTVHDLDSIIKSNGVSEETRLEAQRLKSLIKAEGTEKAVSFSEEEDARMKLEAVKKFHNIQ